MLLKVVDYSLSHDYEGCGDIFWTAMKHMWPYFKIDMSVRYWEGRALVE